MKLLIQSVLLGLLLFHTGHADTTRDRVSTRGSQQKPGSTATQPEQKPLPAGKPPNTGSGSKPTTTGPKLPKIPPPQPPKDEYLGPQECLDKKYTHLSCAKVFCPPWRRCIDGACLCKLPYQCPRLGSTVCGLDNEGYSSMCQALAISCRSTKPLFSHFSETCIDGKKFTSSLVKSGNYEVVHLSTPTGPALVCGGSWTMPAANVLCRHLKKEEKGADKATNIRFQDVKGSKTDWPTQCMVVRCSGLENTLAECTIYKAKPLKDETHVAVAHCYQEPSANAQCQFQCANGKCIQRVKTCDGVNQCGDLSDEMCCKACRNAFHCKTGVCIPWDAVNDGIADCLGGEDEHGANMSSTATVAKIDQVTVGQKPPVQDGFKDSDIVSNPKKEVKIARDAIEDLFCGIPNSSYVYKEEEDTSRARRKRVVGGAVALPTQIQWQVGIQENGRIHCGGAYLGGCWVLTAAHCVRPRPDAYHVKFSLWKKWSRQSTTDIISVKSVHVHQDYNAKTYQNDIALLELKPLPFTDKCMVDNPAVSSVCVPWSPLQFQPNDTCTISGWGRQRGGNPTEALKWANVSIIGGCKDYYKERFYHGMECAGDLDGNVDSCQGDSGGPLVCKDARGVSYVWGIVSWGDICGQPGFPGVYTKVADYFEWIRRLTGWPLVTKYNH